MNVRIPNAFTINKVGLDRHPFPFSCRVTVVRGVTVLDLCACSLQDMTDLLAASMPRCVVCLDADHYVSPPDRPDEFLDLAGVMVTLDIAYVGHDITWAALGNPRAGDRDLVVIKPSALVRMAEVYFYGLDLIGVDAEPDAGFVNDVVASLRSADKRGTPLLATADIRVGPRVRTHDDCYVHVESGDDTLATDLIARTLTTLVGVALADRAAVAEGSVDVEPLPRAMARALLTAGGEWSSSQSSVTSGSGTVVVPLGNGSWRLSEPLPSRVDRALSYHRASRRWELR